MAILLNICRLLDTGRTHLSSLFLLQSRKNSTWSISYFPKVILSTDESSLEFPSASTESNSSLREMDRLARHLVNKLGIFIVGSNCHLQSQPFFLGVFKPIFNGLTVGQGQRQYLEELLLGISFSSFLIPFLLKV